MKDLRITRNLIKNSFYCSISSLDSSGAPHTSPIGSVYLSNDADGYFIEMFAASFKNKNEENISGISSKKNSHF